MATLENANILAADQPLEAEVQDRDSAVSVPLTSSLTSLRTAILEHQVENGRTYHSLSSGKYVFPNDDQETDRLFIEHYTWTLTLRGALALSPKASSAKRVLDAGTGPGVWAIEYADQNPDSEVIGVDLSPVQPTVVPPNCSFEIDDLEKEWTWAKPFDFIFGRILAGSFANYQDFFDKSFAALESGGYLEMHDIFPPYQSDDGTLTPDRKLFELGRIFVDASKALGRPISIASQYREFMETAGFVDIVETRIKWPIGTWPKDKFYKELGHWNTQNLEVGLEGLVLALCTRALGWTQEETLLFCSEVRQEIKSGQVHGYMPVYVVYGKKP